MYEINVPYNSSTDANTKIKYTLYEGLKILAKEFMVNESPVVIDIPGLHVEERTAQFRIPGFNYFAAEHSEVVRNKIKDNTFFSNEWWDLSKHLVQAGVAPILSFDGTMSPAAYLSKGYLEKTMALCADVSNEKPFILNLCFTRRRLNGLKKTKYEWLLNCKKPLNTAAAVIRNELVEYIEDELCRETASVKIGNSSIQNVFHYGNPFGGMGAHMTNIIIPCQAVQAA